MCGLLVSLKFLEQRGVDSSACSTLFFADAGRGEGEVVVPPGAHIRFLIEYKTLVSCTCVATAIY
jgi:hypothetical protein